MGLQECTMLLMKVTKRGQEFPIAEAIVTAPSHKEAMEYAEKELEPFFSRANCLIDVEDLGKIMFGPAPTTIFLYTQSNGRLK